MSKADIEQTVKMIELLPDAVILIEPTSGVLWGANQVALQMYGYGPQEASSLSIHDLRAPESEKLIADGLALANATGVRFETTHRRKSGERFPIEETHRASNLADGQVLVCVIRELSEGRREEADRRNLDVRLNEALSDQMALLEQQLFHAQRLESLGRLAAGVAHDFNNLLGVILGGAELLQESFPERSASSDLLWEIRLACDRGVNLVRQLLAFGGKQVFKPTVFDLDKAIAETRKMLSRVLRENVALEHIGSAEPLFIEADRGQIDQILFNLAVNAGDAMAEGGTLSIAVQPQLVTPAAVPSTLDLPAGQYVDLIVRDTGVGIAPEILPRIFEPFFTTKEPGRGTGLGLATVYGIVRQSGGDVSVESQPGRGTTFRIRLPRAPHPAASQAVPMAEAVKAPGKQVVLLVEDDPPFLQFVGSVLKRSGYVVLEARDGRSAEAVFNGCDGNVDLLVSDLVMPRQSGLTLAERLTKRSPKLRVLLMSGYREEGPTLQQYRCRFLQKPFRPGDLLAQVREILTPSLSQGDAGDVPETPAQ